MNSRAIPVVVHANQFPTAVSAQVAAALRRGELSGKLHYSNWRQARAWLAVHHRYAPCFHARDGRMLYDNPETRAWLGLALEDIGLDPRLGTWHFAVTPDASLPGLNRIEVTFTPAEEVTVRLGPEAVPLQAGQPMVIFRSNRFTAGLVEACAHACGLSLLEQHLSQAGDEGVFLLARPAPPP